MLVEYLEIKIIKIILEQILSMSVSNLRITGKDL